MAPQVPAPPSAPLPSARPQVPSAPGRALRIAKPTAGLSDPCAMLTSVETRSVSPVFVGRAAELAVLGDALARIAASGEPQALLIGGEAGVGKTRLIEEFSESARARGALVALGGCIEIGSEGLPFAPFSSILHTLNWHLRDELAAAVAGQEGELARILPELGRPPARPTTRRSAAPASSS